MKYTIQFEIYVRRIKSNRKIITYLEFLFNGK